MANINDFGIPGVGSGILQPMLKNRWRATFAGLGGGADAQPLSMQVVTFDQPSLSYAEVELHRYNSRAWIAGKHNWEPIKIVCEDDITSTAFAVIIAASQQQQYLIGTAGPWLAASPEGSLYKFATYIDKLDGNEQVLATWTVEGCWLQAITPDSLDYSASEAVKISMNMRFDHAFYTVGSYTGGQGVALGGAGRLGAGST